MAQFPCLNYPHTVLWNVYGDCENYAVMKGHTGAIMELHYSADGRYTDNINTHVICAGPYKVNC